MPLKKIPVPFMKLSNNNHAEVLTKTMGDESGGKGTWSAGLKAIEGFLKKEGVETGTLRQVDGSGLSRMDNVSARHLPRFSTGAEEALVRSGTTRCPSPARATA